jgi:hypothetical protein
MLQSTDTTIFSSKSNKYFTQKLVCEAYGCGKQAIREITMSAGNLGDIQLNLCKKCVPKFTSSATINGNPIHSLPVNGKKGYRHEYIISTA